MAPKSAHQAAQAKAAKEKKILALLAVPLAIALFYAYHTVTKLNQSSAPTVAAPSATATTPTSTVPTGTTESATPSSPVTPTASTGKLTSLAFLTPKDPFHDQGPQSGLTATPGKSSKSGTKAKTAAHHKHAAKKAAHKQHTSKQHHQAVPPPPPPTSAVIAVNGQLASVAIHADFPVTTDPSTNGIFKLVSLTRKTAKIAVVGGGYASGAHTITLRVDVAVTLVNTADGKKYTLVLYPQGTPAPGSDSGTTTTTTTPGG